MHPHTKIAQKT